MRRNGLLCLALAAIALAGCGDDDSPDAADDRAEEARQVVTDLIAAYQAEDYEAVCELQDERVNEAIPAAAQTDTCPEGYEALFKRQEKLEGKERPFTEFVASLNDYEVGEATLSEADGILSGEVLLEGPEEAASLVVEEEGEIKVSELFVTPDAKTPETAPGSGLDQ